MMAACPADRATGVRDIALITLLYRGAMRISATLRLMPSDFDWERRLVRINNDKGGKSRTIALDKKTFQILGKWKKRRESLGFGDDTVFFCACKKNSNRSKLSDSSVRWKFKRLARKAGITKRMFPHLFRHTAASELLEEGFTVPAISRMLGHSNMITTFIYLHELRPDLMDIGLTQREW